MRAFRAACQRLQPWKNGCCLMILVLVACVGFGNLVCCQGVLVGGVRRPQDVAVKFVLLAGRGQTRDAANLYVNTKTGLDQAEGRQDILS